MVPRTALRAAVAVCLAALLACPPVHALVTFNDGKDQLFLTGTASMAYNSNIDSNAGGASDTIYSAALLLEYTRRAGVISVNGNAGIDFSWFARNSDENFADPHAAVEFIKNSGRTTGSLSLNAARESRPDAAANLRAESWNYAANFTFKYPIIERYSISGTAGYTARVFDDAPALADLTTYHVGADLLYALTRDRDLFAGYSFRNSETSTDTAYDDQAFTLGIRGKILAKLSGSLRAGYQIREPSRRTIDGGNRGLTAAGALKWTPTKKLSVAGNLTKDVSVSSTDLSTDTLAANLNVQYVLNSKYSVYADTGFGDTRFLGAAAAGRQDRFFTVGGGVNYAMLTHLKASLGYAYFQNWSTLSLADYSRNTVTLSLSSRW